MNAFSLLVSIIVAKASLAFYCSSQNSTINSTSTYGELTYGTTCFNVSLDILSEIIVHANQNNILGFSFNFINDASVSYVESNGNIQNYSIKLNNSGKIEIRGVAVGGGNGISSLKFLLFDPVSQNYTWTSQYGDTNSSLSFLDKMSSFSSDLALTTINGCIDCNNSLSIPSLVFDYTSCWVAAATTTITTASANSSTILITNTMAPFWSEWNPWFSCLMIRNRIINDTFVIFRLF
jgi:hypothetical protein